MRAEKAVYNVLTNDPGVTGILGTLPNCRVYGEVLPSPATYPAITYHKISATRRPPIHAGIGQSLVDARIQVTCYGQQYPDVKTLADAVRSALDRIAGTFNGTVVVVSMLELEGPDGYDESNHIFTQPLDFMITHYE